MSDNTTIDYRPAWVNYQAYQGDDFAPATITVRDSAGTAIALSDAKMTIKKQDGTSVVSLTVGSGITLPAAGQIVVSISAVTMATLAPLDYRYDLQVTFNATSKTRTLMRGLFSVTAQITT